MYERFKALLLEKGLNAYKVAKATGISNQTFSAWKNGIYTPKQDKLQKIADYLGVSVAYLCGATDIPNEELTIEAAEKRLADSKANLEATRKKIDELNDECEELQMELDKYKHLLTIMNKIDSLTPEQRNVIEALLVQLNK